MRWKTDRLATCPFMITSVSNNTPSGSSRSYAFFRKAARVLKCAGPSMPIT